MAGFFERARSPTSSFTRRREIPEPRCAVLSLMDFRKIVDSAVFAEDSLRTPLIERFYSGDFASMNLRNLDSHRCGRIVHVDMSDVPGPSRKQILSVVSGRSAQTAHVMCSHTYRA